MPFLKFLFSNEQKDNKIEINFIKGAKILLRRKESETETFELQENIKGKYEISTEPGEGEIKVILNGKEIVNKDINLNYGLNQINLEI